MRTKLPKHSNQPKQSFRPVELKDIKPRKDPRGGTAQRSSGTYTLTFNGRTT